MKILIVSDTHRKDFCYEAVLREQKGLDLVIHCGDIEGSEHLIRKMTSCPVEIVMGNNDFFSVLPREKEIQIGKYKVWVTHGHCYNVSLGNERIKEEAKARGVDLVIYGHTHRPVIDDKGEVIAINPGSLGYPRQEGKKSSYIVMELDPEGQLNISIHYLSEKKI